MLYYHADHHRDNDSSAAASTNAADNQKDIGPLDKWDSTQMLNHKYIALSGNNASVPLTLHAIETVSQYRMASMLKAELPVLKGNETNP